MEFKIARQLLELDKEFTKEELRKAYFKKCLQYHPDKNKNGAEMFKLCLDANETLEKYLNNKNDSSNLTDKNNVASVSSKSYNEIFQEYISMMKNKYNINDSIIKDVFLNIIRSCSNISLKIFEDLDKATMMEVYELLIKWKNIFHIDNELLENMKTVMLSKYQTSELYTLEPTLQDLFEHNIYKLIVKEKVYYAPLWHHELYFNNNIVVYINPIIENNELEIDEGNNIIIFKKLVIQDILHSDTIDINIANKKFSILTSELHIKPIQEYRFYNCGIPKINTKEVFDISNLGDIIVYIILTNGSE